jgi:hypothetical protein
MLKTPMWFSFCCKLSWKPARILCIPAFHPPDLHLLDILKIVMYHVSASHCGPHQNTKKWQLCKELMGPPMQYLTEFTNSDVQHLHTMWCCYVNDLFFLLVVSSVCLCMMILQNKLYYSMQFWIMELNFMKILSAELYVYAILLKVTK